MPYLKRSMVTGVCGLAFLVSTALAEDSPKLGEKPHVRIALVAEANVSPETKSLLDLATVELSRLENVELLERADVLRVLDEQKLTLMGLASDRHALAVGKLLKADMLVCLETDALRHQAFAATAFDAKTGVRLRDTPLESKVDEAAQHLTDFVKLSVEKRRRLGKDLKTVAFVSVRNADLPRDWDTRCQAVGRLLERRILDTPGIAVLERRRLEQVTRERRLALDDDQTVLLASVMLIELQVGRGSFKDGLKVIAQLKSLDGQPLKTVTADCETATAQAAVEQLLPKLAAALDQQLESLPRRDTETEAELFAKEGRQLANQKDFGQAINAVEAALALEPSRVDERCELLQLLFQNITPDLIQRLSSVPVGQAKLTPALREQVLSGFQRALDEREILLTVQQKSDGNRLQDLFHRVSRGFLSGDSGLRLQFQMLDRFSNEPPEFVAEISRFRARFREIVFATMRRYHEVAEQAPAFHRNYTRQVSEYLATPAVWSTTPAQYAHEMEAIARPWLRLSAKNLARPARISEIGQAKDVLQVLIITKRDIATDPWQDSEVREIFASLAEEMREHPDPDIRIWGRFLGDVVLRASNQRNAADDEAAWKSWKAELVTRIKAPENKAKSLVREMTYDLWGMAISIRYRLILSLVEPADQNDPRMPQDVIEFLTFMADQHEVAFNSAVIVMSYLRSAPAEALPVLERLIALTQSPDVETFDRPPAQLRASLEFHQRSLTSLLKPKLNPRPATPTNAAGVTAKELFHHSNPVHAKTRVGAVYQPRVVGSTVYFTGFGPPTNEPYKPGRMNAKLVSLPLNGDPSNVVAELPLLVSAKISSGASSGVAAAVVTETDYLCAITGMGIVQFPLKGGEAKLIDETSGLPTNDTASLAVVGQRLFLGQHGGFLTEYDLETKKVRVLVSARRRVPESPFDNTMDLHIPVVIADPTRSRIVVAVGTRGDQQMPNPTLGLWEFHLKTNQWKQLASLPNCSRFIWTGDRQEDAVLIAAVRLLLKFDLSKDQFTAVQTFGQVRCSNDLQLEANIPGSAFSNSPPWLLLEGWLWSGRPFKRQRLSDGQISPLIRTPGSNDANDLSFLERIPERNAVVGSSLYSIWKFEPETNQ